VPARLVAINAVTITESGTAPCKGTLALKKSPQKEWLVSLLIQSESSDREAKSMTLAQLEKRVERLEKLIFDQTLACTQTKRKMVAGSRRCIRE
jgi:hypothetical protein